jgi:hypothetical protein
MKATGVSSIMLEKQTKEESENEVKIGCLL